MVWYLEKYQISEQHILFWKDLVLVEYFTAQQQQLEWETKPVSHLIVISPLLNVPRIDRKRLQQSVGGLKTICYFWQDFTLPLFAGMFSWTRIGFVLSTRVEWQEPFRLWADKWTSVFYSVGVDVCWDNSWFPFDSIQSTQNEFRLSLGKLRSDRYEIQCPKYSFGLLVLVLQRYSRSGNFFVSSTLFRSSTAIPEDIMQRSC